MPQNHEMVIARELRGDPTFRDEWDALELARVVAAEVIRYRSRNGLSQRALAVQLGVKQPQVARLESGEHVPAFKTLVLLARALGVEFMIDIAPAERKPRFVTQRTKDAHTSRELDGVAIVVASAAV